MCRAPHLIALALPAEVVAQEGAEDEVLLEAELVQMLVVEEVADDVYTGPSPKEEVDMALSRGRLGVVGDAT